MTLSVVAYHLCDGGNRSNRCGGDAVDIDIVLNFSVGVLLRAVSGDVTGLAALVAGLAGSVQGATIGGGAVARDVAELAAGIALHGLSLAVAGKVVGTTALVAGSRARATEAATPEATGVAAAAHGGSTAHRANRVGASALYHVSR